MKKSELLEYPCPPFELHTACVNNIFSYRYEMKPEYYEESDTLVVSLYEVVHNAPTSLQLKYIVFLREDDDLTLEVTDAKDEGYKWHTASLDRVLNYALYVHNSESEELVRKVIGRWHQDYTGKMSIEFHQEIIRDKRLMVKQEKKNAFIKAEMAEFPALPDDYMSEFVEKQMFGDYEFLFYSRNEKRAGCSACKTEFRLMSNGQLIHEGRKYGKPSNGKPFICPKCGKQVQAFSDGRSKSKLFKVRWSVYMRGDKAKNKVYTRYTCHVKSFVKGHEASFWTKEMYRTIFTSKRMDDYYLKVDPETSESQWKKGNMYWGWSPSDLRYPYNYVFYDKGFEESLKGTFAGYLNVTEVMKRSKIHEYYFDGSYDEAWSYDNLLYRYIRKPWLEKLQKAGLWKLFEAEFFQTNGKCLYHNAAKLKDVIGICADDLRLMRELAPEGSPDLVEAMKLCRKKFGKGMSREDAEPISWIGLSETKALFELLPSLPKCSIRRAAKYLNDEDIKVQDLKDHIQLVKDLNMPLDRHNILPPNFKYVHANIVRQLVERQDAEQKKKTAAFNRMLAKASDRFASIEGSRITGYFIRSPLTAEELDVEGTCLHHCVGRLYKKRFVSGETNIFFLRKVSEPDVPFFTIEYHNGRVVQVRGNFNCNPDESVETAVKYFEKFMQQSEKELDEMREKFSLATA